MKKSKMSKEITELPSTTPIEELSYEEALNELESIVSELETAEHALESSIALYERGQALASRCKPPPGMCQRWCNSLLNSPTGLMAQA